MTTRDVPMRAGFVYILRNPYFVGSSGVALLKIGGTARSAEARALELSAATGVPGRFSVVYQAATPDWQRLETAVHRALSARRRTGEFFEVEHDAAIAVIEALLQQTRPTDGPKPDRRDPVSFRYAERVRFQPAPSGFDVHVEGIALGALIVTEHTLRYELISEISRDYVVEVDFARHEGSSGARIEDAKGRAAWVALIVKRFTTPDFGTPDGAGHRLVSVNGLAIARLLQRRRRPGLLIRRETFTYDLEPVPLPPAPQLAESFDAAVTITPSDAPPHPERLFVPFARMSLEASVRHYLLDQTLADSVFTRNCWTCHLALFNCEVKLVRMLGRSRVCSNTPSCR